MIYIFFGHDPLTRSQTLLFDFNPILTIDIFLTQLINLLIIL